MINLFGADFAYIPPYQINNACFWGDEYPDTLVHIDTTQVDNPLFTVITCATKDSDILHIARDLKKLCEERWDNPRVTVVTTTPEKMDLLIDNKHHIQ